MRYYVNDYGVELHGALVYADNPAATVVVTGYVGLVDEEEGGMIAYGPIEHMEALAAKLNASLLSRPSSN